MAKVLKELFPAKRQCIDIGLPIGLVKSKTAVSVN